LQVEMATCICAIAAPLQDMLLTNNGHVDPIAALDAIEHIKNSLISYRQLTNVYTNALECEEGREWLRQKRIHSLVDFRDHFDCVVDNPPATSFDIAKLVLIFIVIVLTAVLLSYK
jgi:hypothetical protein